MPKHPTVLQIEQIFSGLNPHSLPARGILSDTFNSLIKKTDVTFKVIDRSVIFHFATAATEMWHRAIHSFLISASLTKTSPVWSSVAGYYSSHYSMRAFAHLLGYFQVHKLRKGVLLDTSGSRYICHIIKKGSNDGEHSFYWKALKHHSLFKDDPFFTINDFNLDESDSGHRNKSNYLDHINIFPRFQILDEATLRQRLIYMARTVVNDAPIPNKSEDSFPDIDNVQLIAYYRLAKYKKFVDEILGADDNRFWAYHRRPNWCPDYFNFQIASPEHLVSYRDSIMT